MNGIEKILIIEDDNALRSTLSYILLKRGFQVSDCMFLHDAAAMIAADDYDLIISDIDLPDGNGLDFCSRQQRIPFVIMSGQERSELINISSARAFLFPVGAALFPLGS